MYGSLDLDERERRILDFSDGRRQYLATKPETIALISGVIHEVNGDVARVEAVRKFRMLHKELDPDDDELTRTRKLRRGFVYEKYARVIQGLYDRVQEIPVQSRVRYRDGREAVIETVLQVRELLPAPEQPQPSEEPEPRAAGGGGAG